MAKNLTIEEIQRQFLFVRGDVEALEQTLEKIFGTLDHIVKERDQSAQVRAVSAELGRAQVLAKDLVERLERIERRLIQDLEASRESEAAAS